MAEGTVGQRAVSEPKPQLDLAAAQWQSSNQGTGDVQIAFVEGYIAMRDGRNPEGPVCPRATGRSGSFRQPGPAAKVAGVVGCHRKGRLPLRPSEACS